MLYTPRDGSQVSENDRKTLGESLFVQASVRTPGSVTAQAAVIAEICKRDGLSEPGLLGNAVIEDRSLVWRIMEKAVKAHKHTGNGPTNITEAKTIQIIRATFQFAADLLVLEPQEISMISGEYYQQFRRREGPFAEFPENLDPDEAEYRFQDSVRVHLNKVHERKAEEMGYEWQRKSYSVGSGTVPLFQ